MGRHSDANLRLMDAARDLMWEESYGAVTIDDICTRADVRKGSFYYFFKSKAELAVAALERMWKEDWKPTLDRIFSSSVEPVSRFSTYLDYVYQSQVESKQKHGKVLGCPVCSVGSEISTQEVDVGAKVREIFSRKMRYYESTLRDALAEDSIETCDPAQKAVALAGLIEGTVAQARIMNDPQIARSLLTSGMSLLAVKPAAASAKVG